MNTEQYIELLAVRDRLFDAIKMSLEEDGHCKPYEGRIEIILPNYFQEHGIEENDTDCYGIRLHCYVIGPNRHYDWFAKSFDKCLKRFRNDVDSWIAEWLAGCDEPFDATNSFETFKQNKMAESKTFPDGIRCFKKHDKAPDFVLGTMVITPNDLVSWLKSNEGLMTEYQGKKQLRLQILSGKDGPYVCVDTYKPKEKTEDLPF